LEIVLVSLKPKGTDVPPAPRMIRSLHAGRKYRACPRGVSRTDLRGGEETEAASSRSR
jgi:hypothetical protein